MTVVDFEASSASYCCVAAGADNVWLQDTCLVEIPAPPPGSPPRSCHNVCDVGLATLLPAPRGSKVDNRAGVVRDSDGVDEFFPQHRRLPSAPLPITEVLAHGVDKYHEAGTWGPGVQQDDPALQLHFERTSWACAGAGALYRFTLDPSLLHTSNTSPEHENAMYISLQIPVTDHFLQASRLPLLARSSHMTIAYCAKFPAWSEFWRFRIAATALLCQRCVSVRFLFFSTKNTFKIDPECELFTLGTMLQELVAAHTVEPQTAFDLHITWHKGV